MGRFTHTKVNSEPNSRIHSWIFVIMKKVIYNKKGKCIFVTFQDNGFGSAL